MNTGGAGYGDPLFRDPDKVLEDLRNEIISDWTATHIFKVVYDPETLAKDGEGTEKLRQKERENRIKRAKPYDAFEEAWLKKRPSEGALRAFGSWPDGKQTREIVRI